MQPSRPLLGLYLGSKIPEMGGKTHRVYCTSRGAVTRHPKSTRTNTTNGALGKDAWGSRYPARGGGGGKTHRSALPKQARLLHAPGPPKLLHVSAEVAIPALSSHTGPAATAAGSASARSGPRPPAARRHWGRQQRRGLWADEGKVRQARLSWPERILDASSQHLWRGRASISTLQEGQPSSACPEQRATPTPQDLPPLTFPRPYYSQALEGDTLGPLL